MRSSPERPETGKHEWTQVSLSPTFARFQTRYPETRRNPQEVIGILKVDPEAGTICSTAYLPWARAAQIHMKVRDDSELPSTDPVFITIFEPPTEFRGTICRDADTVKLSKIVEEPERFYIDYYEKDRSGRQARSELEVMSSDEPEGGSD